MKKFFLLIGMLIILSSFVYSKSIERIYYDNCDSWDWEGHSWTFCERGHFFTSLNVDAQGKGHFIFHNVGQVEVIYDDEVLWKGAAHDTISSHTPTGKNPTYYYDWESFIFKDLDYEIGEDYFCTNYRFIKTTKNQNIFSKDITNCYYAD